jgi:long-chain acyl-CoA synthetase
MVLLPFYNNWILVGTVIIPLYSGGCCVICESDDIDTIIKTMNENAVTNFVCVKSIYDKILDKFLTEINSHFIGRVKYWIAEKLNSMSISQMLFSKYHKLLGGKFRYFLTVGTSIQTNIWKPLTILGFDVKEAYGMAEGTSIVTIPVSKRVNSQSVGQLIEGIKIKIINDEIVLKGPNIMYSYYNSPQLNKELLINGWLFTGDIGYIEANNELYIIGRKNEEIVFSDGRIVNPFEIESMIASYDDYIHDLGVYSSNNMLKIVIVPKPNLIELHGDSNNFETIKDIIRWNVIEYYNHTVPQFKRIKKITITDKILPKSTSGKLKRYLLSSFEVQEVDEFSELLSK